MYSFKIQKTDLLRKLLSSFGSHTNMLGNYNFVLENVNRKKTINLNLSIIFGKQVRTFLTNAHQYLPKRNI